MKRNNGHHRRRVLSAALVRRKEIMMGFGTGYIGPLAFGDKTDKEQLELLGCQMISRHFGEWLRQQFLVSAG